MNNSLPVFFRVGAAAVTCLLVQSLDPASAAAQAPLRTGSAFPAAGQAVLTAGLEPSIPAAPARTVAGLPASAPAPVGPSGVAGLPVIQEESRSGAVFLAALGTSVLGAFAGGATAVWLDDTSVDLGDYLLGVLVGATAGSSLGAALGAELTDRDGSFGTRLLVSTLVGGAGIGLAAATEEGSVLFAIPVLQSLAMVVGDYR